MNFRSEQKILFLRILKKYGFTSPLIKAFLVAVIVTLSSLPYSVSSADTDSVAAKVGEAEITESALDAFLLRYIPPGGFHSEIGGTDREKYRREALNELIEFELLLQEARSRQITVPDSTVDGIVQLNIRKFGSEKAFHDSLAKDGMNPDVFRQWIRKTKMAEAVLRDLYEQSAYPDAKLKEYYETNRYQFKRHEAVHLYHILISVEPNSTDEEWKKQEELARQLRDKIKSGADFGSIAYGFSDDRYRFKSGDLGFIHRGRLTPKELEDAAFALKEGELSPVIRSIYGFHIFKAGEKEPEQLLGFDEVKDKLGKDLQEKAYKEKKEDLIEDLKKKYAVEYVNPAMKERETR